MAIGQEPFAGMPQIGEPIVKLSLALSTSWLSCEELGVQLAASLDRIDRDADLYEFVETCEIDETIGAAAPLRPRRGIATSELKRDSVAPDLSLCKCVKRPCVPKRSVSPARSVPNVVADSAFPCTHSNMHARHCARSTPIESTGTSPRCSPTTCTTDTANRESSHLRRLSGFGAHVQLPGVKSRRCG